MDDRSSPTTSPRVRSGASFQWVRSRTCSVRMLVVQDTSGTGCSASSRRLCQIRSRARWTGCDRTAAGPPPAWTTAPTRQAPVTGWSAVRRTSGALTVRVLPPTSTANQAPWHPAAEDDLGVLLEQGADGLQLRELCRQPVDPLKPQLARLVARDAPDGPAGPFVSGLRSPAPPPVGAACRGKGPLRRPARPMSSSRPPHSEDATVGRPDQEARSIVQSRCAKTRHLARRSAAPGTASRSAAQLSSAGRMFWLCRNRFTGS